MERCKIQNSGNVDDVRCSLQHAKGKITYMELNEAINGEIEDRGRATVINMLTSAINAEEKKVFSNWNSFKKVKPKPEDFEVIAYNRQWIDPDFNPRGIRVGFIIDDGTFVSARWNDYHGAYMSDRVSQPTYWKEIK